MSKYGQFGDNLDLIMDHCAGGQDKMSFSRVDFDLPCARIEKDVVIKETGFDTKVDIYYPEGAGPFPVVFDIHGGGLIGGFKEMQTGVCKYLAIHNKCVTISPDYVLAPQHKCPDAIEELYEVLRFFVKNQEKYNLDMSKIILNGQSAGSFLAIALCHKAYQEKDMVFKGAILCYPAVDLTGELPLQDEYSNTTALNLSSVKMLAEYYTSEGMDLHHPYVSPYYTAPECFPPTAIFTGRRDPLHFSNVMLADKLSKANKEVYLYTFKNADHGFFETGFDFNTIIDRRCKKLMCNAIETFLEMDEAEDDKVYAASPIVDQVRISHEMAAAAKANAGKEIKKGGNAGKAYKFHSAAGDADFNADGTFEVKAGPMVALAGFWAYESGIFILTQKNGVDVPVVQEDGKFTFKCTLGGYEVGYSLEEKEV